jgi:glucuronosyltransferase
LQDLKEFLDGAEHGVILFSLGSSVRAETFPPQKRDAFIQAFAELPQKVLWKWEGDTLPGQPTNVKIVRWIPQMDVLGNYKYYDLRIHAASELSFRTDTPILCNTRAC